MWEVPQGLAQREGCWLCRPTGGSATSFHLTCDFSGNCGRQFHKLTMSYLKHYYLCTCRLRAVNALQLSPEVKRANTPCVNSKPVWGRGRRARETFPLVSFNERSWEVFRPSPLPQERDLHEAAIHQLFLFPVSLSLSLTPASSSHFLSPYLRLCFQGNPN